MALTLFVKYSYGGDPVVDWDKARMEYITDAGTSYRVIADRYNVSVKQVQRVAKRDSWVSAREDYVAKRSTAIAEAAIDSAVSGVTTCIEVANKLLMRIAQRVDDTSLPISTQEFKQISGAIKDLRDIINSYGDDNDNRIEIVMGSAEEFL